jgi:hypothetical protein
LYDSDELNRENARILIVQHGRGREGLIGMDRDLSILRHRHGDRARLLRY